MLQLQFILESENIANKTRVCILIRSAYSIGVPRMKCSNLYPVRHIYLVFSIIESQRGLNIWTKCSFLFPLAVIYDYHFSQSTWHISHMQVMLWANWKCFSIYAIDCVEFYSFSYIIRCLWDVTQNTLSLNIWICLTRRNIWSLGHCKNLDMQNYLTLSNFH